MPSCSPRAPVASLVAVLLVAVLLVGALPVAAARADEACRQLTASGNPQYPPYLWRDPADDNRPIGANADLLQLLA